MILLSIQGGGFPPVKRSTSLGVLSSYTKGFSIPLDMKDQSQRKLQTRFPMIQPGKQTRFKNQEDIRAQDLQSLERSNESLIFVRDQTFFCPAWSL
ncbi:hypothetical protein Bca4012_026368 [Brassica carinata]